MSLEQFRIVDSNPNEITGGNGCLCSPDQKPTGCEPPFVEFPNAVMDTPASPRAVACKACIVAAAEKLGYVEAPAPVADGAPTATVAWEDLTDEDREELHAQFPGGGLTTTAYGIVDVPRIGEQPAPEDYREPEWTGIERENPGELKLEQVDNLVDAKELPEPEVSIS